MILHLQRQLAPNEQPPDWMWSTDDALDAHLQMVAEKRKDPKKHDDDEDPDWDNEKKWRKGDLPQGWR